MEIQVRPIEPDQYLSFARTTAMGFGDQAKDEELEEERKLFEFDRSLAAFDGDQIVGTGEIFSQQLTLPGPTTVAAGGVSWISVLPTHRRRGILTRIMRRQLRDVRERGEPLAILYASESLIYGRFGYGVASSVLRCAIDPSYRSFVRSPAPGGQVAIIDKATAATVLPPIFDRVRRLQPGDIARSAAWWEFHLHDPERWWRGSGPRFYVVHYPEAGEEPDGYVSYRIKGKWDEGIPNNSIRVEDFAAGSREAHATLWQYLLNIDLVRLIEAGVPVDEPLRWMLGDPRHFTVKGYQDDMWARLVDIPAALSARRYALDGQIVFAVEDPFCPENDGRYRLEGSPDGARCERTTAEADLSLQVTDLGATFLGGIDFNTLARAGRVEEHTTGALRKASMMFAGERAPFCRTGF